MNKKILFIFLLGLYTCLSLQAQKSTWYDSSFVTIGGNQLLVFTAGKGKNTIVFESGLGVNGKAWFTHQLFKKMSANNQVICYNRAGYSPSTIGSEPRTLQTLANDLKEVIDQFSVNKKVIIVGHSLGGSIARTYAVQNPHKIKGLMFIETNHEKFTPYANMQQSDVDAFVEGLTSAGEIGSAMEAKQLINNIVFLQSLHHLPDVPVIVITSIKIEEGSSEEEVDNWAAAHASLGEGVKNFIHIKTSKSGHFIYEEEPQLILSYLKKLIKTSKGI